MTINVGLKETETSMTINDFKLVQSTVEFKEQFRTTFMNYDSI